MNSKDLQLELENKKKKLDLMRSELNNYNDNIVNIIKERISEVESKYKIEVDVDKAIREFYLDMCYCKMKACEIISNDRISPVVRSDTIDVLRKVNESILNALFDSGYIQKSLGKLEIKANITQEHINLIEEVIKLEEEDYKDI